MMKLVASVLIVISSLFPTYASITAVTENDPSWWTTPDFDNLGDTVVIDCDGTLKTIDRERYEAIYIGYETGELCAFI